ncbi:MULTISPECIES: hypothetical protein [unclassified Pseudodesulfovibrio]|uniref:hypothetical protein n=1 Tax=unclassified Pseudodesulfovibrio TaxID=2661612 RepID=UPI000FEBFB70|nr:MULTISPECIES: hypothetical protein [unclassified Pseudodesulfovibrio]MCJ2164247.1 hypothetical protein [Pseudodesulfovibrio sp. S3-i]RWU05130.1 hypothetical protein DWB63_05600 [Pseudodesulfovibrio sp. S3]
MKTLYLILLLCLTALPASAFTPDGEELAGGLRKNFGPLTSWEAKMTFPDYPEVSVKVWYAGGKWRQEWQAGDSAMAIGRGGTVVGSCTVEGFASSPLFVWMPPAPLDSWKSWGVDETTGNFGFCGDIPCFMLGVEPGDDTRPAVYLNNEDFAPLLVRYASESGMITVEFLDYKTFAGYRVPQRVVVLAGDERLEAAVEWVRLNGANKPELYERDLFAVRPCAEPSMPFQFLRDSFRYPLVR